MVGSWWFPWCLHIPRCPDPKRTGPNRNKKQPVGIGYVIFSPGMLIRNCFYSPLLHENNFSKMSQFLLLMEEILYHLLSMLMIRPLKKWVPILHINWLAGFLNLQQYHQRLCFHLQVKVLNFCPTGQLHGLGDSPHTLG